MTAVNSSRVSSSVALVACAASLVMTLAACGSDSGHCVIDKHALRLRVFAPSITETATAASACPTAAPQSGGTPEWTLPGTTGSVAVTGSTDTTAPLVKVDGTVQRD